MMMEGQNIRERLKLTTKINDGVLRYCKSIRYGVINTQSGVEEFCEGIEIAKLSYEKVGSIPHRRESEHLCNNARQAIPMRDRVNQTKKRVTRVIHGLTARLRPQYFQMEVSGNCNVNDVTEDHQTFERNRETILPPHVRQERHEDFYVDVMRYRVTLEAQADRTITVITTRTLLGGGIGAAGGGVGGALAGAGAGAITGGAIGLIGTPIGSLLGAGVGALVGAGVGLVGGAAGGAGAGLGVVHGTGGIVLTCTAKDIFRNLELVEKYCEEGGRVIVELSGNFECQRSETNALMEEMRSINGSGAECRP